jgi:DNA-binding transcriptional regulator YiaG
MPDFYKLRKTAGLTRKNAATLFRATEKTIISWDKTNRPPHARAMRYLLLHAAGSGNQQKSKTLA